MQWFLGIKEPERQVNPSPPSSVRSRISGSIPPVPLYAAMTWTGTISPFTFIELNADINLRPRIPSVDGR